MCPIEEHHYRVICIVCGTRGDQHKANDSKCPPTVGWGRAKPFPSFRHSGESPEADKAIDKALAKYWSGTTTFKPKT